MAMNWLLAKTEGNECMRQKKGFYYLATGKRRRRRLTKKKRKITEKSNEKHVKRKAFIKVEIIFTFNEFDVFGIQTNSVFLFLFLMNHR